MDVQTFDYDALAPAVRGLVQEHTGEIRTLARRAAQDIVEIGQRLIEVKGVLGYGEFDGWLKAEFDWSRRAAYNFIKVAEVFSCANFAQLNIAPSALYALASGSTPDFIRQEVIEMAQATGQAVTHRAVKERLQAHHSETAPLPEPVAPLPAPFTLSDNAEMARHKKEDTPPLVRKQRLEMEVGELEMEDGSKLAVPVYVTPQKRELRDKEWDKAATRFENASAAALTYLGKLATYSPDDLAKMMDSPAGREMGTGMRVKQLRQRMQEILDLWGEPEAPKTIDAPLIEVLPPKKNTDRTLEMN